METWIIVAIVVAAAVALGLLLWKRSSKGNPAAGTGAGAASDLSRKPKLDDR